MRLSEKLEQILGLADMAQSGPWSYSRDRITDPFGHHVALMVGGLEPDNAALIAAAVNLLRDHAEDLRQALRDSERLQAALVVGLSEGIYGPHTLEVDGLTAAQEVELNGQRVRLVIEDAAMGRREGEA